MVDLVEGQLARRGATDTWDLGRIVCAAGDARNDLGSQGTPENTGRYCSTILREDFPNNPYGVYPFAVDEELRDHPKLTPERIQAAISYAASQNVNSITFTDDTGDVLLEMRVLSGLAYDAGYVNAATKPDNITGLVDLLISRPELQETIRNTCFHNRVPVSNGERRLDLCQDAGEAQWLREQEELQAQAPSTPVGPSVTGAIPGSSGPSR